MADEQHHGGKGTLEKEEGIRNLGNAQRIREKLLIMYIEGIKKKVCFSEYF